MGTAGEYFRSGPSTHKPQRSQSIWQPTTSLYSTSTVPGHGQGTVVCEHAHHWGSLPPAHCTVPIRVTHHIRATCRRQMRRYVLGGPAALAAVAAAGTITDFAPASCSFFCILLPHSTA